MTSAAQTRTWRDWLGLHPIERIAPPWTARTRDLYVTNGQYTRTLVLAEPPPDVSALWLVPLLDMGGDVTISQQIVPLTTGETKRLLRLRRTQHLSDMLGREKQGRLDDPADAAHFTSATQVEQQVVAGASRLFHVAITLTLRAPTIKGLAVLEGRVREALERLGATCWPATWEHAAGFADGTPLLRGQLRRPRTFDTTTLAYSFLFAASNVGMPAGPVWGVSTHDGRPLRYDPWNRALGIEAPHIAILAPTGTGKTVTAWHLVCESLCGGSGPEGAPQRVILVDPKADYTRGVRYFGGTTLQWHVHAPAATGAGEAHTINVMQIGAGQTLDEAAKATLGLVALATSTPHYPMAPDTTGIWEAAIRAAYAAYGITPDDARTWHTRPDGAPRTPADFPTLATLYGIVAPDGAWDTPTLANALYPWARGTFAPLFARPTSVDLTAQRILSFDLESLTHDQDAAGRLRAVASYLIGTWTWALARATPGRTLLVLDEVETLLAYPETALLVGNWLALGRSYGLQVLHMSQQYLGYTQTPQGRRAISNTPTKLFLRQAGGENIAQLAADFSLTAAQRHFLLSARKGVPGQCGSEALLVTPRGMEQIEIVPPPDVLNVLATGDPAGMHPAVRAVLDEAATVVAAA